MNLNPRAIAQLKEIDPDGALLVEIVQLYLRDTPPRLAEIEREFNAGNLIRVAEVAHSLRSSSAYLGAGELQQLSAEIEEFALKSSVDEVKARVSRLVSAYPAVETDLRALLS